MSWFAMVLRPMVCSSYLATLKPLPPLEPSLPLGWRFCFWVSTLWIFPHSLRCGLVQQTSSRCRCRRSKLWSIRGSWMMAWWCSLTHFSLVVVQSKTRMPIQTVSSELSIVFYARFFHSCIWVCMVPLMIPCSLVFYERVLVQCFRYLVFIISPLISTASICMYVWVWVPSSIFFYSCSLAFALLVPSPVLSHLSLCKRYFGTVYQV